VGMVLTFCRQIKSFSMMWANTFENKLETASQQIVPHFVVIKTMNIYDKHS
jgi:hypothetical protein